MASTQRGNIGYAFGHKLLVYGTGGIAETNLKYTSLFTDTYDAALESASVSKTQLGWVAGGGIDIALSHHFSIRPEYLYTDFGTVSSAGTVMTYTNSDLGIKAPNAKSITPAISAPDNPFNHTLNLTSSVYRVGINYKF